MGGEDGDAVVKHGFAQHIDIMRPDMNLGAFFNDRNIACAGSDNPGILRCLSFRWIKLRKAHEARKYGILGTT